MATGPEEPGTADARPCRRVIIDPEGPVLVEGPVELTLEDGSTVRSDRFMVAVCMCRRSRRYPLCDTSHRRRSRPGRRRGPESSGNAPDGSPDRASGRPDPPAPEGSSPG